MKDKLSLEELIGEMDYLISVSRKSKQTSSPIGKHHVPMLKAIRSILIPVPKEKLGELVDEWASDLFESIWVSPECLGSDELANKHFTLWGNKLLKEYNKLKEGE